MDGIFLDRPNRFIAHVDVNGAVETVHVKNTGRCVKHLHELAQVQRAGYRCAVAFVIQMEGITEVRPNVGTQPEFGTALTEAKAAGVRVLFLRCHVGRDSLEIVEQREG